MVLWSRSWKLEESRPALFGRCNRGQSAACGWAVVQIGRVLGDTLLDRVGGSAYSKKGRNLWQL